MDESGYHGCHKNGTCLTALRQAYSLVEGVFLVRGFFLGIGQGRLVQVKGTLNALVYRGILDNFMLPTFWEQFGDCPFLFQHDSKLTHKARSIITWMREFGVEEFDRPAQSPDLNLVEHLWNELEWRLLPKNPTEHTPKHCGKPFQRSYNCYRLRWAGIISNTVDRDVTCVRRQMSKCLQNIVWVFYLIHVFIYVT